MSSLVVALILLAVIIIAYLVLWYFDPSGRINAALLATAAVLPITAAGGTVIHYLYPWGGTVPVPPKEPADALLAGVLTALISWLVAALLYYRYTTAERANTRMYSEQCARHQRLNTRLERLPESDACCIAKKEAKAIDDDLKSKGLQWVLAIGYINVWERIHRAEEALIDVEPLASVIGGALHDEARLQGSKMETRDALLARLRQAVRDLSPAAAVYLGQQPPARVTTGSEAVAGSATADAAAAQAAAVEAENLARDEADDKARAKQDADAAARADPSDPAKTNAAQQAADEHTAAQIALARATTRRAAADLAAAAQNAAAQATSGLAPTSVTTSTTEAIARTVAREVRRAINEYRDDLSGGLVRSRNHLMKTVIFTGLAGYALLALAVVARVPQTAILAAAAFYLVGAVVGLFDLLRGALTETIVEDYGYSTARLIHTPLYSGLAAIGGVVISALLTTALSAAAPTSPTTATATTTTTAAATSPAATETATASMVTETTTVQAIATVAAQATAIGATETATTGVVTETGANGATATATNEALAPTTEAATATTTEQAAVSPPAETPTDAATPADETTPADGATITLPPLIDIFNLTTNPYNLVVAAIFGLTPGLLISQLQQQAEGQKAGLRSTEATGRS